MEMNHLINFTEYNYLVHNMRARHDELQVALMSSIVPGTKCDPLWPSGSKATNISEWCSLNGTQIGMNKV